MKSIKLLISVTFLLFVAVCFAQNKPLKISVHKGFFDDKIYYESEKFYDKNYDANIFMLYYKDDDRLKFYLDGSFVNGCYEQMKKNHSGDGSGMEDITFTFANGKSITGSWKIIMNDFIGGLDITFEYVEFKNKEYNTPQSLKQALVSSNITKITLLNHTVEYPGFSSAATIKAMRKKAGRTTLPR